MTHFDGETYSPERDAERLSSQLERVRHLLVDGRWYTLAEIAQHAHCSEASASARLRDFRKARFGGYVVERRHIERGLFEYRVLAPRPMPVVQSALFAEVE